MQFSAIYPIKALISKIFLIIGRNIANQE